MTADAGRSDRFHVAEKLASSRMAKLAVAACAFVVVLGLVVPFTQLRASSLWLDEFWSLFFSERSLPLGELYRTRILQELHPPLYFVVHHIWLTFFADEDFAARLFSAVLGVALIGMTFVVGRRFLSRIALFYLLAFMVGGYAYIHFATEARNYMLAFLFGTMQAFAFQSVILRIQARERIPSDKLLLFMALSLANGLTHYYGFMYSGALFGVLSIWSLALRQWRSLALSVAAGAAVFAINASYAVWALKHTRFAIQDNWIPGDMAYQIWTIREYVWLAFSGHHGGLLMALAFGAFAIFALVARRFADVRRIVDAALPHAIAAALLVGFALAVSKLWAPSITTRNLIVSIPSIWLGMALTLDAILKSDHARVRQIFTGLAVIAALWGAPFAFASGGADREEWRASAQFVNGLAACHGKNVPVYAGPRPVEHGYFFSHYLDPAAKIAPTLVDDPQARFDPECPIRVWAVHFIDYAPVEKVIADLGPRARVVEFPNARQWDCWIGSCRLFDRRKERLAIVVLEQAP